MSSISENNKRIAKNTFYLYIRMFITMVVALYTSRVVLRVLGSSDFGLYNVVGGVVTMFSMFSGTLTAGTQRYLTCAMGENDNIKLKKTFSVAFGIHIIVALILIVLAETVGLWFLNTQMNIQNDRIIAAQFVYQFSILAFTLDIVQIPFMSTIIAHENMNVYAYMSIYDVVMKLLIAFLIQYLTYDKLILYALLVFSVNISTVLIYNFYCRRKYEECGLFLLWDKVLAKNMLSFNGWNIIGSATGFVSGQGINILLNIFFGTVVNAAKGISSVVNTYVTGFVTNFQTAANPQIVKLFTTKNYNDLYRLIVNNCRVAGYLFLIIAIPASIEIKQVLTVWLGNYPPYTEIFVILIFLQSFPYSIDRPLVTLINATGKVKWYNLTSGLWIIMILPVGYLLLKLGFSPVAPCLTCALMWMVDLFWTAYFSNKYAKIPVFLILKDIFGNLFIGGSIMFIVPYIVSLLMEDCWIRFFLVCCISFITSISVLYLWGMTSGMKTLFLKKIRRKDKNNV